MYNTTTKLGTKLKFYTKSNINFRPTGRGTGNSFLLPLSAIAKRVVIQKKTSVIPERTP